MFSPPYDMCPYCGANAFGIALVAGDRYFRRCRKCYRPRGHEYRCGCLLPRVAKKVIYLDQMAISNMLKALHPQTPAQIRQRLDPFWLQLYSKLDVLCQLQQVVCPPSDIHRRESQFTSAFEQLRRLYNYLSGDVTFRDHLSIQRAQIQRCFRCAILGEQYDPHRGPVQDALHGRLDSWAPHMKFTVNIQYDPEALKEESRARGVVHRGISEVFARWRTEATRSFDSWYLEEARSLGPTIADLYKRSRAKTIRSAMAGLAPNLSDILNEEQLTVQSLVSIYIDSGGAPAAAARRVMEFLYSDALLAIPSNHISSLLWASIARKAAAGQRTPPNAGMATDVDFISAYLPYCDMMFIDNACRAYLTEEPVADRIKQQALIYSYKTKAAFLDRLDELLQAIDPNTVACAKEVYGDDCATPHLDLFRER